MKQELVDLEGAIATDKIKHNYLVDYQNVSLIKISRVLQFYLFLFKKSLFLEVRENICFGCSK